jgi:hypothetical protein
MADQPPRDDFNKALLANLILMLSSSAMQQLGKLVNPLTNKAEVNLEAAQMTIDMLAMLKEKTKGNLEADEARMLSDILASLQLNFVETASPAGGAPAAQEPDKGTPAATPPSDPAQTAADPTPPKKDPKFRKSYG